MHEYESRLESKSNTSILPLKRKHGELSDDEDRAAGEERPSATYLSDTDSDSDDSLDDFDVSDRERDYLFLSIIGLQLHRTPYGFHQTLLVSFNSIAFLACTHVSSRQQRCF